VAGIPGNRLFILCKESRGVVWERKQLTTTHHVRSWWSYENERNITRAVETGGQFVFRCRARMKMLLEMSAEDPAAIIQSFSTQIFQEDSLPMTSADYAAVIDRVTTEDVNQVCSVAVSRPHHCVGIRQLLPLLYQLLLSFSSQFSR